MDRASLRYFVDSGDMVRIGDSEAGTAVVRTYCLHPSLSPAFASSSEVHKVPLAWIILWRQSRLGKALLQRREVGVRVAAEPPLRAAGRLAGR